MTFNFIRLGIFWLSFIWYKKNIDIIHARIDRMLELQIKEKSKKV